MQCYRSDSTTQAAVSVLVCSIVTATLPFAAEQHQAVAAGNTSDIKMRCCDETAASKT